MLNSVLSGLLIGLGALWTRYAFNRLWQQSLAEDAQPALQAAVALGLSPQPSAWRARVVVEGALSGGERVRLEWRGGLWGAHSLLVRGPQRSRLPLLTSASALYAALGQAAAPP